MRSPCAKTIVVSLKRRSIWGPNSTNDSRRYQWCTRRLLGIRVISFDPGQMRHEAVAVESSLENQTVVVQFVFGFAIQFDEIVKDTGLQDISVGRKRLCDARNTLSDLDRLVLVQGAEKQHVPIARQLFDAGAKTSSQAIVKNNVIFKDENAGHAESPCLANDLQVAEQAPIGARCVDPVRRKRQLVAVQRWKATHGMNSMLIEFALHVLPALRPSIEIDANLVWKCFVDS